MMCLAKGASRVPRTKRITALIEVEANFAAVRDSILRARLRVIITAWDLHS
jgi:hypothetical protein